MCFAECYFPEMLLSNFTKIKVEFTLSNKFGIQFHFTEELLRTFDVLSMCMSVRMW